jgi:hypothetical protein
MISSFLVVLSPEDKAPPEAVTLLPAPPSRTTRSYSRRTRRLSRGGGHDSGRPEVCEVLAGDSSEVWADFDCDKIGAGAAQLDAQLPSPGADLEHFGTWVNPDSVNDPSYDGRWVAASPGMVKAGDGIKRLPLTLRFAHPAIVASRQGSAAAWPAGYLCTGRHANSRSSWSAPPGPSRSPAIHQLSACSRTN